MAQSVARPSKASGSVVVLETESRWPTEAFADIAERDRVVIIRDDPSQDVQGLAARIRKHAEDFDRDGAGLGSAIIACGLYYASCNHRRTQLVKTLIPLMAVDDAELIVTHTGAGGADSGVLFELASSILRERWDQRIRLIIGETEVVEASLPTGTWSGMFTVDWDTPMDPASHIERFERSSPQFVRA